MTHWLLSLWLCTASMAEGVEMCCECQVMGPAEAYPSLGACRKAKNKARREQVGVRGYCMGVKG